MQPSLVLALATLAVAIPNGPSYQSGSAAAYFLDNVESGNSIVSLQIGSDNKLSNPRRISTGGRGSIQLNSTNQPVLTDSLGSQGSVVVSENLLFAVNAGSNTLSLFGIDPRNPYKPTLIGQPVGTLGDFPVSVTYSSRLQKACVLNGGKKAGVACFHVDGRHGLRQDGGLRTLSSSIIDESTPPTGPPGSAAQVLFNPDSSAVFATIKAKDTTGQGSLLAWPIKRGEISNSAPVVTHIEGLVLDFGFSFWDQSTIFIADPAFGAALLHVKPDFTATERVHTAIANQSAVCWTVMDTGLNKLYAIDAGRNIITVINPQTGAIESGIEVTTPSAPTAPGVYDSAVRKNILYGLTGANGIVAVDLASTRQVQYFDLSSVSPRQGHQGMAIWSRYP